MTYISRTISFLLAGLVLLSAAAAYAQVARPPNIILILSDDVGAETIGVYGGESYQTPRIDQLANEGVRFDYGHSQPLCTPSRVKIMTGKYNFRNYTHFGYLDPRETTFAHILKKAGYTTVVAGKWQLYDNVFEDLHGALPADAGFDEFLLWQLKNEDKGSRFWAPRLNHNGELRQHDADVYGPDVFNRYVLNYIEQHKTEPFFIYYPMVLAHDPWVTTPDMRNAAATDQQKFAAMMAYMDKMVGNVRDKVEEAGLAQNTVIFYIGDNGTARDIVSRQRGREVRGAKGSTIAAGSHVPFLAWGPGLVKAGLVSNSLVNLNDVLPTLAALANASLPDDDPRDGISLVPLLQQGQELDRDTIFIHYEPFWPSGKPARYAFDRRWKLYASGKFFDMQTDPLEENALQLSSLEPAAKQAYELLDQRLQTMPGELTSTRRWIPVQFYYTGAGALLVGFLGIVLLWRLVVYWRKKK